MEKVGITVYGCEPDEAALFRELAPSFDVVPTITDMPIAETNVNLASGNKCISVSHKTEVTPAILQALSDVGVTYISTRSTGYNHIDIDFAKTVGITVGNVVYSPDSVADYTLMLMLMAVRSAKAVIIRANAHDYRLNGVRGRELRDMTVGIVGTGRIGTAVMDRLSGFGCTVLAYDHRHKTAANYVSLDELLQQSDIISLHTPLNAETHHLLNEERFNEMKQGAFIINTGRGPLIDTAALIAALESGKLGGAALDVLEGEEGVFYADHTNDSVKNEQLLKLQSMPNVVVTPHTAYYTDHALRDTIENSIANCLKFEREKVSWLS